MNDSLEPIVRAELLIDVVKMVAKRLRADLELAHDIGRALAFGEACEDPVLLLGQRHHRCEP